MGDNYNLRYKTHGMQADKPGPKAPEDLIYEEVDEYNRNSYIQAVTKEL